MRRSRSFEGVAEFRRLATATDPLATASFGYTHLPRGLAGVVLALYGCGGARSLGDCRAETAAQGAAQIMPACVDTVRGAMQVEAEYLPGILECEVGGFRKTPSALEAQAIVARTYLLAHLTRKGPDARVRLDGTFQCWKTPRSTEVREAVRATRDLVLHRHGDVLDANYAAGTARRAADCGPQSPEVSGYEDWESWTDMRAAWTDARRNGKRLRFGGVAWTELLVTKNEGRDGLAVEPTPFAAIRPTNRGAFGQWAAACLAGKRGYKTPEIVRYFFGADVQFSHPVAPPAADSPPSRRPAADSLPSRRPAADSPSDRQPGPNGT